MINILISFFHVLKDIIKYLLIEIHFTNLLIFSLLINFVNLIILLYLSILIFIFLNFIFEFTISMILFDYILKSRLNFIIRYIFKVLS